MKHAPLILLLILFSSCGQIFSDDQGYNIEKDKMINRGLDHIEKMEVVLDDSTGVFYDIYCGGFKLMIMHYSAIPYKESEHWDYLARARDGSLIVILPESLNAEGRISPNTYQRIKEICLNFKK